MKGIVFTAFIAVYFIQEVIAGAKSDLSRKERLAQALVFAAGCAALYFSQIETDELIGRLLLHTLLTIGLGTDLKKMQVNQGIILAFLPAILIFRILHWRSFQPEEYLSALVAIIIGLLIAKFSRKFLADADGLILLYSLIIFGFGKSVMIFIMSLVLTAAIGVVLMVLGKSKKETELPYLPIYTLAVWAGFALF